MTIQSPPPTQPGAVVSEVLKVATDAIVAKYPATVASSVGLGLFLFWLGEVFKPYLQTLPIDLSSLSPYPLIGLFLVIGIAINKLRKPKRELPQSIEEALIYIRLAKKEAKLTDVQIKIMYISLYKKLLENVELSKDVKQQLEDIAKK